MLDIKKPVRTIKDHLPVDILSDRFRCVAKGTNYNICGYVHNRPSIEVWDVEGKHISNSDLDIENGSELRWLNMYHNKVADHATKEEADKAAGEGRIARVKIVFKHGQMDE